MNDTVIDRLEAIAEPMPEKGLERMRERAENREAYRASLTVAAKISKAVKEHGYSVEEFADLLNEPMGKMCDYLFGDADLTLKTLVKIESILGIELINRNISIS